MSVASGDTAGLRRFCAGGWLRLQQRADEGPQPQGKNDGADVQKPVPVEVHQQANAFVSTLNRIHNAIPLVLRSSTLEG